MAQGQSDAPVLEELEARIGYVFVNPSLLNVALTHVSAIASERTRTGSYQRLEFLGDRVLGLAISDMLYAAFPRADEGELSRRLAGLVRRETCAEVGLEWSVGAHLRLGESEAQTGGRTKAAILADVCEAIIGAVFLDGGFTAALHVVRGAWEPRMRLPRLPLRDAKTALQEWAQARGLPTPTYAELARSGPAHAPEFTIAVTVAGFRSCEGTGASKRIAEQAAAAAFLAREAQWSDIDTDRGAA
ncbi:MAG: ribonuclease III [Methylobacteriaceae bacterium]|nr:ribonuclease III [Methylobacteriaceae bacterium]MBV9704281.1 ribonuclease III [Methylobacteriaceae bacterium]